MSPLVWLAVAVAAGVGAYFVGAPAWQGYRRREARDTNAERYLAWRGRAVRGRPASAREGMTGDERRRIYAAGVMAALGIIALIAFFATS